MGQHVVDFPKTTYDDLCKEMLRIQQEQEGRKRLMDMCRIKVCLETMKQFGTVVEVFLNVSDAIALMWGPMKFVLQVGRLVIADSVC